MPKGRKTGGRQKGTPNKVKRDVAEYAQQFTEEAIDALRAAMKNPRERVAAAIAILNRGYGSPSQTVNTTVKRLVDAGRLSDDDLAHIAVSGGSGIAETEVDPSQLH